MAVTRKSMQATVNGLVHVNVSELSANDRSFVNLVRACMGDMELVAEAYRKDDGTRATVPYLRVKAKRIGAKARNGVGGRAYSFHNFDKLGRAYTSTRKR